MIQGCHAMFYTSEPEALRAFFRDVLGLPFHDVGQGWLILDLPEADLGCHPAKAGESSPPGTHSISFYCTDLPATVEALRGRGAELEGEIRDAGYGLTIVLKMPGGVSAELYQPHYQKT